MQENYPLLFILSPLHGHESYSKDLKDNFFRTLSLNGFEMRNCSDETLIFRKNVTKKKSIVVIISTDSVVLHVEKKTSPSKVLRPTERIDLVEIEKFSTEISTSVLVNKLRTLEAVLFKRI